MGKTSHCRDLWQSSLFLIGGISKYSINYETLPPKRRILDRGDNSDLIHSGNCVSQSVLISDVTISQMFDIVR